MLNILIIISLAGLLIPWTFYLVEAWRTSLGQGLLVLLLPCYVFYWAYIRSRRANPFRWGLLAAGALLIAFSGIRLL